MASPGCNKSYELDGVHENRIKNLSPCRTHYYVITAEVCYCETKITRGGVRLPTGSFKEATSLYNFKSLSSKWAGPECNCGSCVLCKVYDVSVFFPHISFFIDLLGYTRDYIILYIITNLCFSQIDELYQSPYRRCHVSYFLNVCL